MRPVLIDSSAFLSLEDPDEVSHARTREVLEELVAAHARLVTTSFVFDETYTILLSRLGRDRAVLWGEHFRQGRLVQLVRVEEAQEDRAWDIIRAFTDKDFSYTDATSFAVAESLAIGQALSLDRHFVQYGELDVLPAPRG